MATVAAPMAPGTAPTHSWKKTNVNVLIAVKRATEQHIAQKPDQRKQQHGGKAMLVGPPREHFLGVVVLDSPSSVPIPIGDLPRREPPAGAHRRQGVQHGVQMY